MTDHAGPGEGRGDHSPQTSAEHLVLALTPVPGSTAACAAHGDAQTVAVLADYSLVADAAAAPIGELSSARLTCIGGSPRRVNSSVRRLKLSKYRSRK